MATMRRRNPTSPRRLALAAFALPLALAALGGCGAEEDVSPTFEDRIPPGFELKASARSIDLGRATKLEGTLTQGEENLGSEGIRIEQDLYPFDGDWSQAEVATTEPDGSFTVRVAPDSNTAYRATFGEDSQTQSRPVRVYVDPQMKLSVSQDGGDTVFETTFRHPDDRSLAGSSVFHYATSVSDAQANGDLPFARVTQIKQDAPGRSVARLVVSGSAGTELAYDSCVKYKGSAGMGRPGKDCSQTSVKYRR